MKKKSKKHTIIILIFIFVSIIFNSGSHAAICSVGGDGSGCLKGGDPGASHSVSFKRMFSPKDCPCNRLQKISKTNFSSPIAITYEDMIKAYNPNNDLEYYYSNEDSTYQMDIGTSDLINAQHWIMPNCYLGESDYGNGISPSKTLYLDKFPSATHCKVYKYEDEEYYEYYEFSQQQISLIGSVYHNIPSGETEVDTADFLMAMLPLDLNTNFTAGDSLCANDTCFVYHEEISPYGFGSLTTPDGEIEVLVLLNNYKERIYSKNTLIENYNESVLTFISKEGNQLNILLAENSPLKGNVVVDWLDYTRIVYNPTEVNTNKLLPSNFKLFQNYPNPFNPTTNIKYELKEGSHVTLKIFDQLGKEIEVLEDMEKPAGTYEVKYDANKLSSGIYFYQITAGNNADVKKMLLMK